MCKGRRRRWHRPSASAVEPFKASEPTVTKSAVNCLHQGQLELMADEHAISEVGNGNCSNAVPSAPVALSG